MFKQEVPTLQLSVQQGTADVPVDGQYHVLLQGAVLLSTRSKKKALDFYQTERDRLFKIHGKPERQQLDRKQWLLEERARSDIQAMRSEWLRAYGAKEKKGGKGGRGGV